MPAASDRTKGADIDKTLFLVRHGETEWNASQRMQGRWNSDLNAMGRDQASSHGRLLAGQGLEAVFSSTLDRARQTTEIITRWVDAPVIYDDRIVEWDCGDWSGHLRSEVETRWAEEYAALLANPFNYRGPNCETFPDMFERARPFVDEVLAREERVVAIVSHGMIGKVMASILVGLYGDDTLAIFQPNDAVFRIRLGPDGHEVHHWRGGVGPVEGFTVRDG